MNGPDDQRTAAARAFALGGAHGELMSRVDWAATPFGPAGSWQPRLVEILRVVLAAPQPMALFWGPDLAMLYNEGYAAVIGSKHPRALGAPVRELFPESWEDTTRPFLRSVVDGRRTLMLRDQVFPLRRHGYLEQAYFDISHHPVVMDDGTIGGVLTIVSETTRRVLGERRLRVLAEIGSRATALPTARQVADAVAEVLAGHPEDVPFVRVYLASGTERRLTPAAWAPAAGGEDPSGMADGPEVAALLAAIVADAAPATLPAAPFTCGGPPAERALALPLNAAGRVEGVLVAGVNPLLPLEGAYRDFFEVLASGVAASLSAALAQEEHRRRADSLAELDRAKTTFFSNVSHEFRTPLTLFLSPLQEALADEDRPERREQLELAERNALRLLRLVNTLLDASRAEAGRLQGVFEPVDLSRATAEIAGVFRSTYEAAGLKLDVDCPPLPRPVRLDQEMWEKIVFNLLSNALKFTFTGGVRVRTDAAGDRARLIVADTGIGIPAAELPHLFERFHQVPGVRARSIEGSGIGLALVKDLVEVHGGTIAASSRPAEGTEFTVEIPFGTAHLPREQIRGRRPVAARSASGWTTAYADEARRWLDAEDVAAKAAEETGRPRVLIAEDNPDIRSYLHKLLLQEHDVLLAADGRAALETALEEPLDMVVTDAMMPGMDGFALVQALRGDPRTARLPIIMLTARAGEEAAVQGLYAGADEYLTKPFSARQLLARVRANLELSRLRERVLAESRRHVTMLTSLAEVGLRLSGTLEPRQVLEAAGDLLVPSLADQVHVHLAASGAGAAPVFAAGRPVCPGQALTRAAARSMEAMQPVSPAGHGGVLGLPMVSRDQVLGAVAVARDRGGYSQAECRFLEAVASRLALAYDNAIRYQNERRLALTLQRALLPEHLPQVPGLRTASYYRASATGTEIGGDWYDVLALPEECVGLAIGDVMGHDVDAATVMGRLRTALQGYALDCARPGTVLAKLGAYLHSLDVEHFATCLYAVYEPRGRVLRYATGGHLPPLVVAGGRTEYLKLAPEPPLGLVGPGSAAPADHEVRLAPGSCLLLYTDGLVENRGLSLDEGLAALRRACGALPEAALADPQRVIDRARDLLDAPGRADDDTALLAAAVGRP